MTILVDQPGAAPTRKWTNARIAEVLTALFALAATLGFELGEEIDTEALIAGVAALVTIAGGIVGYFTKNEEAP